MRAVGFFAIFSLCLATNALADDDSTYYDTSGKYAGQYLCLAEAAGGLKFDDEQKRWTSANFKTDNVKFIVAVKAASVVDANNLAAKGMAYTISIRPFGADQYFCFPVSRDGEMSKIYKNTGRTQCMAILDRYDFNFEILRYMRVYAVGFIDGSNNNDNTPLIEAGTCSRID